MARQPGTIRVDNGPQYLSGKLLIWGEKCGITIQHIQPGQPQQNAYIQRYNRTVRLNEITDRLARGHMNGLTNISSKVSRRPKTTPRNGYGLTITTA